MRIITETKIREYAKKHPNSKASLFNWIAQTKESSWKNIQEVRAIYPHADLATVASGKTVVIFNISGNNHRLITALHFNTKMAFILKILTHAQYDKNHWKSEL
jgi:mRNA interferase HigB